MSIYQSNISDPDVDDWVARVVARGSGVSAATKRTVLNHILDLKSLGLWSRIYRYNLMAGNDVTAATTPIKVAGGTGNAVDTNNGPFVNGDFNESTTGLRTASGNSKYLDTGFIPNTAGLGRNNYHGMSFLLDDLDTADANSAPFFATDTSPLTEIGCGTATGVGYNGNSSLPYIGPGCFGFSCRSDGVQAIIGYGLARYMPGSAPASLGGSNPILLFAGTKASSSRKGWGALGTYSIGLSMTDAQLRLFSRSVHLFNYQMGRVSTRPTCVCFGDSITRGSGLVSAGQRWSRQFANALSAREVNYAVSSRRLNLNQTDVNPYAIAGINSYQDMIDCQLIVPHTVAIQLGVNDLYDDPASNGTQATADLYSTNLKTIAQYLLDHGVTAANIYIGSPSYGTDANFGTATKQQMYATAAQAAANNKGVKYVPIYEVTSTSASYTLQADGIHPSAGGHIVMANTYTAAG